MFFAKSEKCENILKKNIVQGPTCLVKYSFLWKFTVPKRTFIIRLFQFKMELSFKKHYSLKFYLFINRIFIFNNNNCCGKI